MTRVRFRLAPLLKLRQAARDARRAELGQAYQAATVLAHQQSRLDAQLHELRQRVRRAAGPGPLDLEHMLAAHRYEAALRIERTALEQQAALLSQEIERRRTAVVAADRALRVLEKLRDRQQARHQERQLRETIKQLDDLASQSAQRRRGP